MGSVRPAAVSGIFYPGSAKELEGSVDHYLSQVEATSGPVPKAIIAPHAGYIYSGAIAASVYARILPARDRITRVILLGPCHKVAVRGLAASSADAFATPLRDVQVDKDALARVLDLPQVNVFDATHAPEHSLEVHLPFLQRVLAQFKIVPLVVGDASTEEITEVLDILWGGPETLIVVSSDLSHYLSYAEAQKLDSATCRAIETLDPAGVGEAQACGRVPVRGLLALARRKGLQVSTVDLRNSGDTAGPKDRVVGYGSWAFVEPSTTEHAVNSDQSFTEGSFGAATKRLLDDHGPTLLKTAAASILNGLETGQPLCSMPDQHPEALARPGACFVTLKKNGHLRGCIGTPIARRPLIVDCAENGFAAAFRDPRFPAVTADEISDLTISISVLSPPQRMSINSEADLLRQLRPGIDGLIIVDQNRRALFLPSVWQNIPRPAEFLRHLKQKAGLTVDHWTDTFQAHRFVAEEISVTELADPRLIWLQPERA